MRIFKLYIMFQGSSEYMINIITILVDLTPFNCCYIHPLDLVVVLFIWDIIKFKVDPSQMLRFLFVIYSNYVEMLGLKILAP